MLLDKMSACADMILTDAIEDMAEEECISIEAARDRIVLCGAYDCLYNFESGLWKEGPDYFRCFVKELEKSKPLTSESDRNACKFNKM